MKKQIKWLMIGAVSVCLGIGAVSTSVPQIVTQAAEKRTKEVNVSKGSSAKDIQVLLDQNQNGYYDELIVKIPEGDYYLNTTLYVDSNTTIKADPAAHFYKMNTHTDGTSYGAMLEGRVIPNFAGYGACHDITIEGGVWDSEELMNNKKGTETFRFIHGQNITVRDAVLCNVPKGSHLLVFGGCSDVLVERCEFFGYGKYEPNKKVPKEAIQLDITHDAEVLPTSQKDVVVWDDLPCRNVVIQDCNIHDFSRAIGSHTAVQGVYHDNITIKNNKIMNMQEVAIKLFNYTNTVVSDNMISGSVSAVLVYTDIADKSISDSGLFLTPNNGGEIVIPDDFNVLIENNKINYTLCMKSGTKTSWGDAIRVLGSDNIPISGVTIRNNDMRNTERYGIYATHTLKLAIENNEIYDIGAHGILIDQGSVGAKIQNNNITNAGQNGISAYSGSDNSVISGNVITKPKEAGIYLYNGIKGCQVGVSKTDYNTITGAGKVGIHLTKDAKNNTVAFNSIDKTGTDGIFVYNSSNNTLKNNKITSAGANGIWISGSPNCTLTSNTITKYSVKQDKGYGIGLIQSGGTSKNPVKLTSNKVTGTGKKNTTDAIRINSCNYVTMTSNTVKNADGCGISLYKCKNNVLSKNTITTPMSKGIYASTDCDKTTIKNCTVSKAKDVGISIYKAPSSTITSNTVTVTGSLKGIWISTSNKSTMKSNTVKGTKEKKQAFSITSSTGCTDSKNVLK